MEWRLHELPYIPSRQDSVNWHWFTLLGGLRYDHFEQEAYTSTTTANGATTRTRYRATSADAVSPRGGLTVRPLDWLVFFGNISQTRTPMLGLHTESGATPTKPWYATQYEGGVRVSPAEKLWVTLSTYRIEQENVPEFDNAGLIESYDGRNTSRGAELSISGDVTDNWTVMGMCGSYVDKDLRFDPSHLFDVNVSMPLSKFGGSKDWILTFGVRNLFGEKYFESARHYYECLVGEPRTFEIGIRATF